MLEKRTEAQQAADKAAMRSMWRVYKAVITWPGFILLIMAMTFIGYAKGYFDGATGRPTILESSNDKAN